VQWFATGVVRRLHFPVATCLASHTIGALRVSIRAALPLNSGGSEMKRRTVLLASLAGAGSALAQSQKPGAARPAASSVATPSALPDYPTRPITLVVPFPPGGPTDGSARVFAKSMAAQLGQPIVIDNRAGAGGSVGTASVARSPSDGYTLLWAGTSGTVVAPALYNNLNRSLRYDPLRSFEPIAMAVRSPMLLAGTPRSPGTTLNDLVRASAAKQLTVATAGTGSVGHLSLEYLREFMKLNTLHVPYKGGAPALTDLLGGHVDLFFDSVQFLAPQIRDGKVKPYATTGSTRSPILPNVPTVAELIGKPFESYSWFGLAAPAETPRRMLRVLNAAMNKASQDPAVLAFVKNLALETVRGTDEQFAKTIFTDYRKWSGVAARANIRPEE
jgi:tripartite-type tricarboxylate transporter receptor subunit TctC